jgi:hypothetical protein
MRKLSLIWVMLTLSWSLTGQNLLEDRDISGPSSTCIQEDHTYSIPAQPGATSYTWSVEPQMDVNFNPSATTTVPQVIVHFNPLCNSGKLYVTINSNPTPFDSLNITVYGDVTDSRNPTGLSDICLGLNSDSVVYTVNPPIPQASWYSWKMPDNNYQIIWAHQPDSITVAVRFLTNAQSGQIQVKGKNPCSSGPATPGVLNVNVNQTVSPAITIIPFSRVVCTGSSVPLDVVLINGGQNGTAKLFLNSIVVDSFHTVTSKDTAHFILSSLVLGKNTFRIQLNSQAKCVTPGSNPAQQSDTVHVSDHSSAGTLVADHSSVCEGTSDTIRITGNMVGTAIRWLRKMNTDSRWDTVFSSHPDYYIESTASAGSWQYRVVVKSGVCPNDTSGMMPLTITQGPGVQTLVPKKNNYPPHQGSLFLLCKTCDHTSQSFDYHWGKVLKNSGSDQTCSECGDFEGKDFCLFTDNDTTQYKYYLRVSSRDQSGCSIYSYYPGHVALEKMEGSSLNIYPNPGPGKMTLELSGPEPGPVNVIVSNMVGQEVRTFRVDKQLPVQLVPLDLGSLVKGVYVIEALFSNGDRVTGKTLLY